MTGKTIIIPTCPRPIRFPSSTCPSATTARWRSKPARRKKSIRIREIHMEEDAGKLIHDPWEDCTLIDYNRCGVPLIEIVTQPDMRSAEEAVAFLDKLKLRLQYLGVSDCKMQEGSLRADLNISVRKTGESEFGIRTEMKNMNSFKAISKAIEVESARQIEVLEDGGRVTQETRRWDDNKDASFSMRSKENAQDYRYFPDPDLVPLEINEEWIRDLEASLPELPEAKRARYAKDFDLSEYDILQITAQKEFTVLFDQTVSLGASPKETANWILGDLSKSLNDSGTLPEDMELDPNRFCKLISMVDAGKINRNTAKQVFSVMFENGVDPEQYVKEKGLEMVSDTDAVAGVIDQVLSANEKAVEEYRAGKQKAYGFLVGQVMRELRGKADPAVVNQLLREMLDK